jgi:hypothetical protein
MAVRKRAILPRRLRTLSPVGADEGASFAKEARPLRNLLGVATNPQRPPRIFRAFHHFDIVDTAPLSA